VALELGAPDDEANAVKAALEEMFGTDVDASGRIVFHTPTPIWVIEVTLVAKGFAGGIGAAAGHQAWKLLIAKLREARKGRREPGFITVRTEAGVYTVPADADDEVLDSLDARLSAEMPGTYEWRNDPPPGHWVRDPG
jgi:hypothetical protein